MSRAGLCQALEAREALPGERTLDKAFASLGRLEGVQTQWGKRGERLYRVGWIGGESKILRSHMINLMMANSIKKYNKGVGKQKIFRANFE